MVHPFPTKKFKGAGITVKAKTKSDARDKILLRLQKRAKKGLSKSKRYIHWVDSDYKVKQVRRH